MRETHGQKAMRTLTLMDVTPDRARGADVRFERMVVAVPGLVRCPTCRGNKHVLLDAAGKPVPVPQPLDFPPPVLTRGEHDLRAWNQAFRAYMDAARKQTDPVAWWKGTCPTCRCSNTRARLYGHCTGTVPGTVEKETWVGNILWPAGTRFDSRFSSSATGRHCCELCARTLGPTARRVPVVGTDTSGAVHGFLVGEDCARKFLPGTITTVTPDGGKDFVLVDVVSTPVSSPACPSPANS